jgi:toxin-antitoxin system PIN domain toxin
VFAVDTNILVYAVHPESLFHDPCRKLVTEWAKQTSAWFLTWGIIYEFLRVTTHPRVLSPPWQVPAAWGFIEALLASPGLRILTPTGRHRAVAGEVFRELPHLSGNLIHDATTAILMREHGVRRIYTRDTHFHRFPFLEPLDPLV